MGVNQIVAGVYGGNLFRRRPEKISGVLERKFDLHPSKDLGSL